MREPAAATSNPRGTSQARLEAILRAKREWESAVDVLPHAIFMLDSNGRVVRANAAAGALDPGGLGALLGQPVRELLALLKCDAGFDMHWKRCWDGNSAQVSWSTAGPEGRWFLNLQRADTRVRRSGSSLPRVVLSLTGGAGPNEVDGTLFDALEEERRRIAIELHDGIGQSLTAVTLAIEGFRRRNEGRDDRLLALAVEKAREAMEESRRIAMALRPAILDDLGLLPAIGWLCRELRTIHPHLVITERLDLDETSLDRALRVVLYRLVQESVNNAVKHAAAGHIEVHLLGDTNGLALRVSDNGRGLPGEMPAAGLGLSGIAERIERSGGELAVSSAPGRGTAITAFWPRLGAGRTTGSRQHT